MTCKKSAKRVRNMKTCERNVLCTEVYSSFWGYFMRQISYVSSFKLFHGRNGKITKSKGFSRKKRAKASYRRLMRQIRTCLMVVSREKMMLHENHQHTFCSSYYFLIKYFYVRKSLWFHNFTTSKVKWFETWDMRNLSCEVTTAT